MKCAAVGDGDGSREVWHVDAADEESCRPDFGVAIYPGIYWNTPKRSLT